MRTLRKKCIMIRIRCSTHKGDKVWKRQRETEKGSSKNVGGVAGEKTKTFKNIEKDNLDKKS